MGLGRRSVSPRLLSSVLGDGRATAQAACDERRQQSARNHSVDALVGFGLALTVTGVGWLLARATWDNYDGVIMGQVAMQIVDKHSIVVPVDPYHLNSPHSFYGIGMSLLMIPTMELLKHLGSTQEAGTMATNAWLLGLLTGVTYAWCRIRNLGIFAAGVVALIIALGAGLLPFASTGFAEVALATAIAAGLLGVTATSLGCSWGPILVGAAAGAAVVTRDDSLLLIAPWLIGGALVAASDRIRTLIQLALGGLPFGVVWCWYNYARFGTPLSVGYSGVLKFNHPVVKGLYGLVASPGKGLVFYAPIILVAMVGVPRAWRRSRTVTVVAAGLLLSRLAFFAPYWGWYGGGGFGPRYVLPATPVLAVGLMEVVLVVRRQPVTWQAAVVVLAGVSVLVGVAGAAVDYQRDNLLVAVSRDPSTRFVTTSRQAFLAELEAPSYDVVVDRHMFDWGEFPITDEISRLAHEKDIASPALEHPIDRARLGSAAGLFVGGLFVLGLGNWISRFRRDDSLDGHDPTS